MRSAGMRFGALVLASTLLAAACGDDDDDAADTTTTEAPAADQTTDTTEAPDGGEGSAVTVTVTADAIEVPEEITGGAVEVTIEGGGGEVDFTQVEEGTTEEAFVEGMASLLQGGPAPDFLLGNAGASGGSGPSTILLEPGSYIVWTEPESEGEPEGEEAAPMMLTTTTTVTEGEGELPETDGTITARDYEFEIDAAPGDTYTFLNEGPEQLHHVVLFNFGEIDPAAVEENFPAFLEAEEGAPPPEALADVDFATLEAGGSPVFSADGGGTFETTLEAGTTYVAACFITDLAGGPPHAIGNGMWQVFTLD